MLWKKKERVFRKAAWFIFLLYVANAGAQPAGSPLTLQKAISLGLANSKILKASAEKIKMAVAKVGESNAQMIPQLNLGSSYVRVSDNVTPLSVKFPGAATALVLNPQVLDQFSETITVSELVYAGGRIKKTVGQLDFLRKASELDYENDKEGAIINIISAYYNLYSLQQSEKILDNNEALLKARLNDLRNLEKNGIVLPNDVLKLEIALTQLNVQQADIKNAYEAARYGTAILLGLNDTVKIVLDTVHLFTYSLNKPYSEYESAALSKRPDLMSASERVSAARTGIEAVKANYLPTLATSAAYNYLKPNQRWLPQRNQFDGTWYAGLSLTWNAMSLLTNRHYIEEAKSSRDQFALQRAALADNIKIELYNNYMAYLHAVEHLKLTEKTLEQTTENYRLVNNQLQNSTVLPADLQDALSNLRTSQLNVLIDKAAIDLAYFKFLKSAGMLTK